MDLREDYLRTSESIPSMANFSLQELTHLIQLLNHRKSNAQFYLNSPNVDKEATIESLNHINNQIKQYLGL